MARQRSPDREKAKEMYINSNGQMKLKDIAAQLGFKDSQIRKWKSQDKWDDELKGALPKNNGNVTITKKDDRTEEKSIDEIEIDNPELTEKQRLFCLYYVKNFNATQAAIKAGYAPNSAHVTGHDLLRNPKVAAEIKKLKGKMTEELFIDAMDVLNKYIKIAFADMTDFVEFGTKEEPVIKYGEQVYDANGNPVTIRKSYIDFKDSSQVDGSLICEIKTGKQGMSIKLEDRQKALDKLAEYFDLFPDKFKRRIEEEKLKIAKEKLELEKGKTNINGDTGVTIIDDIKDDDTDED